MVFPHPILLFVAAVAAAMVPIVALARLVIVETIVKLEFAVLDIISLCNKLVFPFVTINPLPIHAVDMEFALRQIIVPAIVVILARNVKHLIPTLRNVKQAMVDKIVFHFVSNNWPRMLKGYVLDMALALLSKGVLAAKDGQAHSVKFEFAKLVMFWCQVQQIVLPCAMEFLQHPREFVQEEATVQAQKNVNVFRMHLATNAKPV